MKTLLTLLTCLFILSPNVVLSENADPVEINFTRQELINKWRERIQSFLDRGVIPVIDLQSSISRNDSKRYLQDLLLAMDNLGVALIAFDGYQSPKGSKKSKGYRWSSYTNELVNAYPNYFIPTTNGGTNNNWLKNKKSFVNQVDNNVRAGKYFIIGELDFRHYMSKNQCKNLRIDRDSNLPLDGKNGKKIFALSSDTGTPFVIHHEPEDHALNALEKMIKYYPKAKVIVAHFGQIRHPERQQLFKPKLVRRLLNTYPNIFYDLSTGHPNRIYKCMDGNKVFDTVIWRNEKGNQSSSLDPAYRDILENFSNRFVAGTDYGRGRGALAKYLKRKIKNHRLIIRDVSNDAKHDICYRNAWKLLTGESW